MVKQELFDAIEEAGGQLVPASDMSLTEWDAVQWESDGCEDIQPSFPIIKVIQRMSGMEGASKHVGEFWHSDREGDRAFEPDLEIVALVKRDTRALFEEGEEKPSCMSQDGKTPMADMPAWQKDVLHFRDGNVNNPLSFPPVSCATCPFSMWGKDNTPPRCRESKVLLVERQDDHSLAQLRISGMSIKPFEQFVAKYLRPKGLPLYSKRLIVTTAEKRREAKTWEEMEFHPEQLPIEEAMHYAAMLRTERERFERTLGEDVRAEWQDDVPTDGRDMPFE